MSEPKFAELENEGSVAVGLSLGLGLSMLVLLAMLFLSSLLIYLNPAHCKRPNHLDSRTFRS
jgi:hypothetical protein